MKQNKLTTMWHGIVLTIAMATVAGVAVAQQPQKTVGITGIIEHPAVVDARNGVRDELTAQGFTPGVNLQFNYLNAQGSPATASQIARKLVSEQPDVIVGLTTPSAQAIAVLTTSVPLVFGMVADPVLAKLVPGPGASRTNVTGVSDFPPLEAQFELMYQMMPALKRLGVLVNPGEANSVANLARIRKIAEKRNISIVVAPVTKTAEVPPATKSLLGSVDAIYIAPDSTVVSAQASVISLAHESKVPTFGAGASATVLGALGSVGYDYYELGRSTGKIVARVLRGEKPGDIPWQSGTEKNQISVNLKSMRLFGLTLPDAAMAGALKTGE